MMPVELNRMSRSADATGPFGSRTPPVQPPSVAAPIKAIASTANRMLNLLCSEAGGTSRGIRLQSDTLRALHQARGKQFSLPLPSLAQLSLPLVGRVAAGSPILAQEHIDRTFLMEASMFSRRPDYLLKVRGMSMRDAGIMDGDLLAVQKASEARSGQIVVARLGEDVTVKRFKRTRSGVELVAENPEFKTIVVGPGDAFAIEGLAVGLIRNNMLM